MLPHKGSLRCNGDGEREGFSGRLSQGVDGGRKDRSESDSDPGRGCSGGRGGVEGDEGDDGDSNSDRGDQLSGVDEPRRSPSTSPSPSGSEAPCSCSCPGPEGGLGWSSSSGPDSGGPMTSVTTRARSTL